MKTTRPPGDILDMIATLAQGNSDLRERMISVACKAYNAGFSAGYDYGYMEAGDMSDREVPDRSY
jgi:hypothetical protein